MRPAFLYLLALLLASPALAANAAPTGLWATLYSTDARVYAANLRQAGCPEATVGLLVSQEINAQFRAREEKLQVSTASAQTLRQDFSLERREALIQLRQEKNELLRAALGIVPQETARLDWSPAALARLSPQQRDLVRMVTDDYDAMFARIMTESRGHFLDEDREKLRFLETERSADLGKLLTTDEILDFELAKTNFGRNARARLKLFAPTQEQLRTYLALGKKHGLDFEMLGRNSTRMMDAQRALSADLAAAWDEATYNRFRMTTSSQYEQILNLTRRLGHAESVAIEIFTSQKNATEQAYALHAELRGLGRGPGAPTEPPPSGGTRYSMSTSTNGPPGGPRGAVFENVTALAAAHCDFVRARLGDAGFDEYLELNRGWLTAFQRGNSVRLSYSLE